MSFSKSERRRTAKRTAGGSSLAVWERVTQVSIFIEFCTEVKLKAYSMKQSVWRGGSYRTFTVGKNGLVLCFL